MWAATNRRTSGGELLGPEQCVDNETALRAYTSSAAHLSFEERQKGTLEPGKLGDVVIVDRDPLAVAPEELNQLRVDATIIGGVVAYER
jgi:predicted amidohydrolase YtcJ